MSTYTPNVIRAGMTLLELLVALALLGLMTAVVELTTKANVTRNTGLVVQLDSLRDRAFKTGRPQSAWLHDSTRSGRVLVLPTGRVIADASLGIDPLTGGLRP